MHEKIKIDLIQKILDDYYPESLLTIPLDHKDPYTLLVAVLLSAQTTDIGVNKVTKILFAKASTPEEMIKLSIPTITDIVRPCGLGPSKGKAIWGLSHILLDKHDGQVPQTFEKLEALPGVGHKTASVVMAQAFGKDAFAVDTHIQRCAKRWGLSSGKNVVQTEKDLKKVFPKDHWIKLHLQIIYFGREHCKAKGHKIEECPICRESAPKTGP